MIQLAYILPTTYLQALQSYLMPMHLALAHQVLADKKYTDFYVQRRQAGEYLILDNSAFELGSAIADQLLDEAIQRISPNEIVLPDVLFDGKMTEQRVVEFLQKYGGQYHGSIRFMAVPHGKDLASYVDCYHRLATMPQVDTIGIGAVYVASLDAGSYVSGRQLIFETLQRQGLLADKPHHLLGLGSSGHQELEQMKSYEVVRSCDSSAAFIHALNHEMFQLGKAYVKDRRKIDFTQPFDEALAARAAINMQVLRQAAI